MTDLKRRSFIFGPVCGAAATAVPTAALALPLAGNKPVPIGATPPTLEELAQVVVVHPRRRRRHRRGRWVCWWHRGRRVCGWR